MLVGKPSDLYETRQAFGLTYLHRITVAAQRRILTGLPLNALVETRALDPRQVKLVSTSNLPLVLNETYELPLFCWLQLLYQAAKAK